MDKNNHTLMLAQWHTVTALHHRRFNDYAACNWKCSSVRPEKPPAIFSLQFWLWPASTFCIFIYVFYFLPKFYFVSRWYDLNAARWSQRLTVRHKILHKNIYRNTNLAEQWADSNDKKCQHGDLQNMPDAHVIKLEKNRKKVVRTETTNSLSTKMVPLLLKRAS